jgi:hypothetical protein
VSSEDWEGLRREIEALQSPDPSFPSGYYTSDMVSRAAVLAIVDRLAATPSEDGHLYQMPDGKTHCRCVRQEPAMDNRPEPPDDGIYEWGRGGWVLVATREDWDRSLRRIEEMRDRGEFPWFTPKGDR